jgi:hypothetical protein
MSPLLNYTTEVPAGRSIAEITQILQEGGAQAIVLENAPDHTVSSVSFLMTTTFGRIPFKLPVNVPAVMATLNDEIRTEDAIANKRSRYRRKLPRNLLNNRAQAERVAWRIAKDWLEAQLALAQIGSAKFEQIMLPFADMKGKSFYQRMIERGSLALPAPEEPAAPVHQRSSTAAV